MRIGLGVSALSHVALIAVGVLSLGSAEPFDPAEIEAIPIELVSIEDVSNIRVGSLDSDVIETETPSAVDSENEAQLAEPTGNTEEDQITPEDANIPTPAPTEESAPEPQPVEVPTPIEREEPTPPAPEPKPDVQPEPDPVPVPPAPEPEPEPEPEPTPPATDPIEEVIAAEDTGAEPEIVAPRPPSANSAVAKARVAYAEKLKKQAAAKAAENAAKADKISDIINKEQSKGSTTGSGGKKTAGKTTGRAARLSQSAKTALAAKMLDCFFPPLSARNVDGLYVRVLIDMQRDGRVAGTPQVLEISIQDSVGVATASAAQRAVRKCAPYNDILTPESFDDWRQIEVKFDPKDAF